MRIRVILPLLLITWATAAQSGSLCGTVRDAQTSLAVAKAGVFVYQAGTYTGMYAASDGQGAFCIDPIAAGTYDLQVKVNDYETTWTNGVVVADSGSAVDILTNTATLLLAPWPNPASSQVRFRLRARDDAEVRLDVFDVRGRLIQGWRGRGGPRDLEISWGLTDPAGATIPSGTYFVRLRAGRTVMARKLVLTR